MRLLLSLVILSLAAAAQTTGLPPDYAAKLAALEQARRQSPRDPRVLEALAGSYAMGGRHHEAAAVLRELLPLEPSEETRLRLARNLAWAGDSGAAIETYEQYLQARPEDRAATLELIRLKRWRGDYSGAERLCNRLLAQHPDAAAVLALKAEVLHWAGHRKRTARHTAERAAYLAPDLPDAQVAQVYTLRDLGENRAASRQFRILADQVARRGGITPEATFGDAYRLLETELTRSGHLEQPGYSIYNDADGIHNTYAGLQVAAPVGDHKLRLDLGQYRTSAPLAGVFTAGRARSLVNEFTAGTALQAAPGVYVTGLAGGSRRSGGGEVRPLFDLQVSAAAFDRWSFDLGAAREFLKVTPRAVDLDVSSYKAGGGVQYAFDSRTSLAFRADRRWWSDDNRSLAGEANLRRILHYYKPFMIDAGALSRWERFDRDTRFAAGFFTPERYRRHDAYLGLHGELGRRLRYELRGSGGAQQLARGADYRPSWEAAASASLRLADSLYLYASYQRRNYSLVSRHGWYQGFFVTLAVRP